MLVIRNVGTTTSEIDRGIRRVRDRWRVPLRAGNYRLRRTMRNTTTRTTNRVANTATKAPALIPIRSSSQMSRRDRIRVVLLVGPHDAGR